MLCWWCACARANRPWSDRTWWTCMWCLPQMDALAQGLLFSACASQSSGRHRSADRSLGLRQCFRDLPAFRIIIWCRVPAITRHSWPFHTVLNLCAKFQWDKVRSQCRAMVRLNATNDFTNYWNQILFARLMREFIAQMLSIPIRCAEPELLYKTLFEKYNIEIPVMRARDDRVLPSIFH